MCAHAACQLARGYLRGKNDLPPPEAKAASLGSIGSQRPDWHPSEALLNQNTTRTRSAGSATGGRSEWLGVDFLWPCSRFEESQSRSWRASYVEAITWIGACVADALHYAHERG